MNGIWCLFLLGRMSMVIGWYEMIRGKVSPNNEFVSVDVSRFKDPGSYEMLGRDRDTAGKTPETRVTPSLTPVSPAVKSGRETPDYFGREARYKSPSRSFSAPKPPPGQSASWDSNLSHATLQCNPLSMNKI
jgi:hypothetical protein